MLIAAYAAIAANWKVAIPATSAFRYHGIFGPAAKDRELVVPARGGRVAHNKRKGKAKCGPKPTDFAASPESATELAAEPKSEIKLVGASAEMYGSVASDECDGDKYTTKCPGHIVSSAYFY